MEIERASEMGFCFGVRRAIDMLRRAAREHGSVEALGAVVHNHQVVSDLARSGVGIVDGLEQVTGQVVAVPSHGAGPDVLECIKERGLQLVDATCPIVHSAQRAAHKLASAGFMVVIFGDADHPEVNGVLAWCQGRGVVTTDPDISKMVNPLPPRLGILPQTTQTPARFAEFVSRVTSATLGKLRELRVVNTICDATRKHQAAALELARRVDIMVVVGGHHSANTRRLAEVCAAAGVDTIHVETAAELDSQRLQGVRRVGVSAGASTPDQAVDEAISRLEELAKDSGSSNK